MSSCAGHVMIISILVSEFAHQNGLLVQHPSKPELWVSTGSYSSRLYYWSDESCNHRCCGHNQPVSTICWHISEYQPAWLSSKATVSYILVVTYLFQINLPPQFCSPPQLRFRCQTSCDVTTDLPNPGENTPSWLICASLTRSCLWNEMTLVC